MAKTELGLRAARLPSTIASVSDSRQRHGGEQKRAREGTGHELDHRRLEAEGLAEITLNGATDEARQLLDDRPIDAEVTGILLDHVRPREDRCPDARRIAGTEPHQDEDGDGDQDDDQHGLQHAADDVAAHPTNIRCTASRPLPWTIRQRQWW